MRLQIGRSECVISDGMPPERYKREAGKSGAKNSNSGRNRQLVNVFWLFLILTNKKGSRSLPNVLGSEGLELVILFYNFEKVLHTCAKSVGFSVLILGP